MSTLERRILHSVEKPAYQVGWGAHLSPGRRLKFFPFDADAIADLKHVLYLGQCKDAMNESLYKDRMRAAGLEGLAEHRSLAARVVMEAPDLTPSEDQDQVTGHF